MAKFHPIPTAHVARIRADKTDSNGQPVETPVSNGDGILCRHCMQNIPKGETYLVLGYRPFEGLNPYTETGPLFFCTHDCTSFEPSAEVPEALDAPDFIVRGYSAEERIVYGTGKVTQTPRIPQYAADLLSRSDVAFVDIRSAKNNCFQCRVLPD